MPGSTTTLPLPPQWPQLAADALVHAVAMARVAIAHVHGGFAGSPIARIRLRSQNERLRSELAQIREQVRIKDVRFARIPAKSRPRYLPGAPRHHGVAGRGRLVRR